MSCIKFPSSKSELIRPPNKENYKDFEKENSHLIRIANDFFGKGNWNHAITNQTLDFVEYIAGKYQAGCVSIVKIQLKDGTFHEDMGYICSDGSTKGSAIQKARFGSFNSALKKVLKCFGYETYGVINKPLSISNNSIPTEISMSPNKFLTPAVTNVEIVNQMVNESFEENISISQTDALMDKVDLELFSKDQNSNDIAVESMEVKENIPKLCLENSAEVSIVNMTSADQSVTTNKDNKINIVNGLKQESKTDTHKVVVSTAMTEEEMRLERKRKQREMQEEFKRKEEIKKKYGENGAKPMPNPRY